VLINLHFRNFFVAVQSPCIARPGYVRRMRVICLRLKHDSLLALLSFLQLDLIIIKVNDVRRHLLIWSSLANFESLSVIDDDRWIRRDLSCVACDWFVRIDDWVLLFNLPFRGIRILSSDSNRGTTLWLEILFRWGFLSCIAIVDLSLLSNNRTSSIRMVLTVCAALRKLPWCIFIWNSRKFQRARLRVVSLDCQ
jgi:hypothetical protein